ncbi:MAG: hypothetical protein NVSMB27_40610 [Ktedonobacteraceae bacterium]
MVAVLDTVIQGYIKYFEAQEVLLQASRSFAREDSEQQTRLSALAELLPTLDVAVQDLPLCTVQSENNGHSVQTAQNGRGGAWQSQDAPQHVTHQSKIDRGPSVYIQQAPSLASESSGTGNALPGLSISCFGHFEVQRDQQLLILCQNRSGQSILRYLMAQPGYCATPDMLMAVLWPDDEQEVARRKLQVSVSALRRSLNTGYASDRGGGYILCKNQFYLLNPAVLLKTDVDEFMQFYKAGQRVRDSQEMVTCYERACQVYSGPFLVEDTYADWACRRREQLSRVYLTMCSALSEHALAVGLYENAIRWASTLLAENQCDEGAHRQLMLAYLEQGRRSDALRQFHRCTRILRDELGVEPMPETVRIFQAILTHSGCDSGRNQNRAEIE